MKLQILETPVVEDPSDRSSQHFAVDLLLRRFPSARDRGRLFHATSLLVPFHLSQTPFKLNRFQFGLGRSLAFFTYPFSRKPRFHRLKVGNGVALRGRDE